ncbi:5164_t:CDS:2 [Gigaspora margarita]|uniref:5164_t:CDS:1 n=1 Tax=Gigaspora margarita TaxID=4874 RepID=A0ABN7USW5_GIGMA|nr:5164_t:CDS:2 [Gigaspora margarita]
MCSIFIKTGHSKIEKIGKTNTFEYILSAMWILAYLDLAQVEYWQVENTTNIISVSFSVGRIG